MLQGELIVAKLSWRAVSKRICMWLQPHCGTRAERDVQLLEMATIPRHSGYLRVPTVGLRTQSHAAVLPGPRHYAPLCNGL
jgi:hypothetical protein